MSESGIDNEIPMCRSINGPIKDGIALYKAQIKTQTIYRLLQ